MVQGLRSKDHDHLAEFITTTFDRRKNDKKRIDLEDQWKEVDRQILVQAQVEEKREESTTEGDWMPTLEMPNQAEARELLVADAHRLLFPRTEDWYAPCVVFTDELGEKLKRASLHPGDSGFTELGVGNQEAANTVVRAGMDYFHSQYDFRGAWDALLSEAIKYGSYVGRVILNTNSLITNEFRGQTRKVPMLIPSSIKNTYLDDSAQFVAQEGMFVEPSFIREYRQSLRDLENAARFGRGWIPKNVAALTPDEKDHVQLIEYTGDAFVPRSRGRNIDLKNMIITLAVAGERKIVRIRESEFPFRNYVSGTYERDDAESPYGTSPLLRGRPLQEWVSEAANRSAASAALNAEPPTIYDSDDKYLVAQGGPKIEPGVHNKAENPQAVQIVNTGDPNALMVMWQAIDAAYQRVTKVNDPRRGGGPKSHSTAFAEDLNFSRGILPTESFVNSVEDGPLLSFLYMEFEMGKKVIGNSLIAPVKIGGTPQHIEIFRDIWPDRCDFLVFGSKGALTKREKLENTIRVFQLFVETEQLIVQSGGRPTEFDAFRLRIMNEAGISNADELLGSVQSQGQATETGPGLSEVTQGT